LGKLPRVTGKQVIAALERLGFQKFGRRAAMSLCTTLSREKLALCPFTQVKP